MNRALVMALASGLAVSVSVGAADISWASPVDGMWNTAANWSPAMVPSAADRAVLGFSGPYTVNLNVTPSVAGLAINNPEAVLVIPAGRSLTIGADGIFNDGWIVVNETAAPSITTVIINSDSDLDGSGLLTLNGSNTRARVVSNTDALLTHRADHTVNGFGQITLRFDNQGWIVADTPGETLIISGATKTNSGVISGIDNGVLELASTTVDQAGGGIIEADGGSVILNNSTVTGGILLNSGLGSDMSLRTSTLNAVTLSGDSQLVAGFQTNITGGSLINNGLLRVNSNNAATITTMNFPEPTVISGNGTIRLDAFNVRARMIGNSGSVENSASHSIRGYGQITCNLTNSGLVSADVAGEELEVSSGSKLNLSTMRAEGGGVLELINTALDQSPTAELLADGGQVQINGTTINDGRLVITPANGSAGLFTGNSTVNDVTIEGQWVVNPGVQVTLRGVIDGSGTTLVNPGDVANITTLNLNENVELDGTGAIRLDAQTVRARIISASGTVLTQGPDRSIFGWGQLSAGFVNNGLVEADVDAQELQVIGQAKVNNAMFRATGGGILSIVSTTVDQTGGGVIEADGGVVSISATTVAGGVVRNTGAAGSQILINNNTFDAVEIDGDSILVAGNQLTVNGGSLTNNGLLNVNPSNTANITTIFANGSVLIDGSGEIALSADGVRARIINGGTDLLTLGAGQTLSGAGQMAAAVQLEGTLAPGLSVGTLTGTRPISFTDSATFACEFNDEGAADRYSSNAAIALNGTLEVSFIDGFTASSPEAFEIISTTNEISGRFDQVTGDAPPAPLVTRVVYEPTRVRVGFVCPSDATLDGATDLGDLNAVLANFGTNASFGDVTGDGSVDLADLNLVLANFGTDCTD